MTVLRRREIPPLPTDLAGRLVVFGVPSSMGEERMRRALVGWGRTLTELRFEADASPPGAPPRDVGRWHARFGSHEQAAEAMDELEARPEGANGVALWYNDRDYMQRGWVSASSPRMRETTCTRSDTGSVPHPSPPRPPPHLAVPPRRLSSLPLAVLFRVVGE